jgi:hypothetical protein
VDVDLQIGDHVRHARSNQLSGTCQRGVDVTRIDDTRITADELLGLQAPQSGRQGGPREGEFDSKMRDPD